MNQRWITWILSTTIAAASVIATIAISGESAAGDRELEVLMVNMTPDDRSTKSSRECVDTVRKVIAEDYTRVTRLGESKLREAVGKPAGEPFLDWEHGLFEKARERGDTRIDAVVLVDCRPESRALDALVVPSAESTIRIRLRGRELSTTTVQWITRTILRRAWVGFSP